MPVPRTRPVRAASSTLVPTPSVDATSTGSSNSFKKETLRAPPKDPIPRRTLSLEVVATLSFKSSTALLPSSMFTPAEEYDVKPVAGARQAISRR